MKVLIPPGHPEVEQVEFGQLKLVLSLIVGSLKRWCFYFAASQPDTLVMTLADLTAAVVACSASQTGATTGEQDAVRSLASPVLLWLLRHPTSRRWWLVRRGRPTDRLSHLQAGSALE